MVIVTSRLDFKASHLQRLATLKMLKKRFIQMTLKGKEELVMAKACLVEGKKGHLPKIPWHGTPFSLPDIALIL